MLAMSPVATDARVIREAESLAASGWEVDVIGLGSDAHARRPSRGVRYFMVDAGAGLASPTTQRLHQVVPLRLVDLARWALLPYHRRARTGVFLAAARATCVGPYDVVHAHDLPTLAFGQELAGRWDARVVYDAHEWWAGRRREERPTPIEDIRTSRREQRLGGQADAVLTVSDAIAEHMARRYGWRHVTVVRNTFPTVDGGEAPPRPAGLLYAGRIAAGRDLQTVLAAAPALQPLQVSLLGPVNRGFLHQLDDAVIRVLQPLPVDDVDDELRRHGLALITLEDGWVNHRMALPNKLFQAVRAGVPVVASDLPELRRVVSEHGLGTLYEPGCARSLIAAVTTAVEDYTRLCANVKRAQPSFDWKVDAARLLGVYASIAPAGQEPSRR